MTIDTTIIASIIGAIGVVIAALIGFLKKRKGHETAPPNITINVKFEFSGKEHAPGTLPNISMMAPSIDGIQEGEILPNIYQEPLEPQGPVSVVSHDDVLKNKLLSVVEHTGRLSGPQIEDLLKGNCRSVVKFFVVPIASGDNILAQENSIEIATIESQIKAEEPAPNVWYWKNSEVCDELLFTAHAEFVPEGLGLKVETLYKFCTDWRFYDYSIKPIKPLSFYGFSEGSVFEIID